MIADCTRETEIVEAIGFGRWPDHCPELAAHAASCDVCRDVVEVARALHADCQTLCREAQPPAAGMVWWRATIRARAEAARTVTQPISVVQGIAGASIVGAAAGLVTVGWQSRHWAARLGEFAIEAENRGSAIAAASALAANHSLPILLAVAAGLVLAPLALYLALADD